jgi:hypothetical protein
MELTTASWFFTLHIVHVYAPAFLVNSFASVELHFSLNICKLKFQKKLVFMILFLLFKMSLHLYAVIFLSFLFSWCF